MIRLFLVFLETLVYGWIFVLSIAGAAFLLHEVETLWCRWQAHREARIVGRCCIQTVTLRGVGRRTFTHAGAK